MPFSSAYMYVIAGIIIEVVNAILTSYMDENDMWGTAITLALGGFLFPFFFALPLVLPNFIFTWREILILAPYSIGKTILLIAWIWSLYAYSTGDVQTIRLKIRAINSLIGLGLGIGFIPFVLFDVVTLAVVCSLTTILAIVAVNNIKGYRNRKKLLGMIVTALRKEGIARIDELVLKLKLPDYLIQDLIYELCNKDIVDVIESRGLYVYLKPQKL